MSVTINFPLQTLTMKLEIYGEESRNAAILNGNQVAFMRRQGGTQDAWSKSPVIISDKHYGKTQAFMVSGTKRSDIGR